MVQLLYVVVYKEASRQLPIVQLLEKQIHVRPVPDAERGRGDLRKLQVRLGGVRPEPKVGETFEDLPAINTKGKEVDPEYVLHQQSCRVLRHPWPQQEVWGFLLLLPQDQ